MDAPLAQNREQGGDRSSVGTPSFLFIASDWRGVMLGTGVGAYIDSLAQGLMSLGSTVKMLAVLRPYEEELTGFLEKHRPWVIPFQVMHDRKPENWLGRKCVSVLEILRCLSPNSRRVLEGAHFFPASTASIARLERLLSMEKPTVVVFVHLDVKLYALALSLLEQQQPYVIIAHGRDVGRLPNYETSDLVRRGVMLKGASWIAANSRHTKSLLEPWRVPSERVKILHPPISEEAIRESVVFRPASRDDGDLSLVTICRLDKGKGIDVVMRALKILAAGGIPFHYTIGGDGSERKVLEALVDELGLRDKVHFKGTVEGEEKWHLLRNSDVFIMPSREEGFGIAFIEAAAFGVPAVGSRTGGIPDAVVDGQTGILVPEDTAEGLADALTFLYRKPQIRKQMGRAAGERARTQFSPITIAARFREEASSSVRH